jgi:NAD(P)-dependent dehydrogenase (short-subunit alcohol dehydrogenase family)
VTVATRPLSGRHALITGANRGIGAAVARTLSEAGASVTLMVRDAARAQEVADALVGPRVVMVADVTDRAASLAACAEAAAALGPVDILVNNAGSAESALFMKTDVAMFERMIAVHLMAAVHTTHAVLPSMLERRSGQIVNVASIAGLWGAPYITAYASAKHALVGFTRALALEVASRGVAVNAVCPGYTDTELVQEAIARIVTKTGRSAAEARQSILDDAQQARMISVQEVADAVLALCTAPAGAVGGQAIVIDGASRR